MKDNFMKEHFLEMEKLYINQDLLSKGLFR